MDLRFMVSMLPGGGQAVSDPFKDVKIMVYQVEHAGLGRAAAKRRRPGIWRASQAAADVRDLYTPESQQELEELVAWASKEQQQVRP